MKIAALFSAVILLPAILTGCASGKQFIANKQLEKSFQFDRRKKLNDKAFEAALKKKCETDVLFRNGATPLIMAVVRKRPDRVEALLKAGANVNFPGKFGGTPLHAAAATGQMQCFDLLLKAGADVNAPGILKKTPLMEAARMGNTAIIQRLLKAGAQINAADTRKRTALMHAAEAQKNSLQTVKILITAGADPILFDEDAMTAAMHATAMRNTETALFLIDLIPDLPNKPVLGLMIMYHAIKSGDIPVVEKLIDKRIPLNRDPSILFKSTRLAQIHGFYRILVRTGALENGRGPLHWAARTNNLDMVKLLISRGADPLQTDELNDTADEMTTSREVFNYIREQQRKELKKYKEYR